MTKFKCIYVNVHKYGNHDVDGNNICISILL